jgi:hypothetical protein
MMNKGRADSRSVHFNVVRYILVVVFLSAACRKHKNIVSPPLGKKIKTDLEQLTENVN